MRHTWLILLATACTGTLTGPPKQEPEPEDPAECDVALTPGTPLRLLTRSEYNLTVRDLLGATGNPSRDFPKEPLAVGLDNDATLNRATPAHVERWLDAAEALAADAVTHRRDALLPCTGEHYSCAQQFIARTGLRAFRRPLTSAESATLNELFATVWQADGFDAAMELTLQSYLQAPQFLYRDEAPTGPGEVLTLYDYRLASRLSYFLWGSMPDNELLDAAANGVLNTPEGLTAQARRMLEDPKSADGLRRFFSVWLYLEGVEHSEKNTTVYPEYSPALAAAWRTSLLLFIDDVMAHEGTLPALLTSNALYVNSTMTGYGMQTPARGFVRSELDDGTRRGLLTQPGFLAFKALPDSSSPVRRGLFVLDKLLCQSIPPPPAVFTPPQPSVTATTRERFAAHSSDDGCYGCHRFIDPIGFTFEHYDGLGRWRDTENGKPVDSTGGVVLADDDVLLQPVSDIVELAGLLAQSPQVHACVAKDVYRFALGRGLTGADTCTVAKVSKRFVDSGGDFRELMLAIVQSDAFRTNSNAGGTP